MASESEADVVVFWELSLLQVFENLQGQIFEICASLAVAVEILVVDMLFEAKYARLSTSLTHDTASLLKLLELQHPAVCCNIANAPLGSPTDLGPTMDTGMRDHLWQNKQNWGALFKSLLQIDKVNGGNGVADDRGAKTSIHNLWERNSVANAAPIAVATAGDGIVNKSLGRKTAIGRCSTSTAVFGSDKVISGRVAKSSTKNASKKDAAVRANITAKAGGGSIDVVTSASDSLTCSPSPIGYRSPLAKPASRVNTNLQRLHRNVVLPAQKLAVPAVPLS